jgi:Tol biopolymer transport system component
MEIYKRTVATKAQRREDIEFLCASVSSWLIDILQYKSATQRKLYAYSSAWFKKIITTYILTLLCVNVFAQNNNDTLRYADEKHFKNVRQLTFGGDNAEAYWSYDGKQIIFQRKNEQEGIMCDRMFIGNFNDNKFLYKQVSIGNARTTCGYFLPDGKHIVYASTHLAGDSCPPVPDRSKFGNKYIWPVYASYDIFLADTSGKIIKQLTNTPGYDAEATLSPDGKKMIFTSTRNGDLDLYVMELETYEVKQITNTLGYDGGAWFSPDGKKIVWRASRPKTDSAIKEYKDLLAQNIVMPTQMEVFVANADGSDAHQITNLGQANWAPNFTPDGKHIIFCSNHEYKHGFPFNMYLVNLDGSGLQKISHDKGFDAFPMFSYDGKKIIFSSTRNNGGGYDINVFVADWIE